jgi:hypothetical protein
MSTHAKEIMKYAQWAQVLDDKELRKVTEVKFDNCEWTACNFPDFCDSHKYRVAFTRIDDKFIFEPTKAWLNGKEYLITENMCSIEVNRIWINKNGALSYTSLAASAFTLKPPLVVPPKDTKVLVRNSESDEWTRRYSAGRLNGKFLECYSDGQTSWSIPFDTCRYSWELWKLAEE